MPKILSLTHDGHTRSLAEWARVTGIPSAAIWTRLNVLAWPAAKALTTPVATSRRGRGGRPKANVPRPCPECKPHASGRAFARWKAHGKTHERYFGEYGTDEAATAYRRFAAEWAAGSYEARPAPPGAGATVAGLVGRWLDHCERYYVKDGVQTSEVKYALAAARVLNDLYGDTLAAEFTPGAFRACREVWVGRGLSRTTCNSYATRVVRCFRWGAAQSIVPAAVHDALKRVEHLAAGRTSAPDRERRKPVHDRDISVTLAHLASRDPARAGHLAAMIQLQRLTGMRPGEVCAIRPGDLDTAGDVWRYEVGRGNKNRHRGRPQVYYLGPKAVAVLASHLRATAPGARVFPIAPGPYRVAVKEACVRAGVVLWTPHQLRHALATEVAERFRTLEHAAAAIGDTEATAAAVYVHLDPRERAKIEVARAMG